jgi:hypothetical protein
LAVVGEVMLKLLPVVPVVVKLVKDFWPRAQEATVEKRPAAQQARRPVGPRTFIVRNPWIDKWRDW